MANISDVVKRSGISKSTVSRVINNHPSVSKEKRELVLKAMEELNYIPNLAARKMRGHIKTSIGVIVPNVTNPFFSYLIHSIERTASDHNMRLIIFQSNESKEKELEFLNLLKLKQIDGVIFTAIENDFEVINEFHQYGPLVFCNEYLNSSDLPTVRLDQQKATYLGIKHLIEYGYKKIAYCTGGLFANDGKDKDRNNGFRQAMEEAGLDINPEWIFVNQHTIEDGKNVLYKITKMSVSPDAIFTGSDEVASGITIAAREKEMKIPEDLGVLGFDDQPIAKITYPQLSTIHQPIEDMGRMAAELMIKLFHDETLPRLNFELSASIVKREST